MSENNYDLTWISEEKLIEITKKSFAKALKEVKKREVDKLQTDPTLLIALNSFLNISPEELDRIQISVSIVKSLQNAIGNFHQSILGSIEGWRSTGTSGGVFDIESIKPVQLAQDRKVIAEVKMRHNTIKASDECKTWDKLKEAAASRGGVRECVAYIIQIIPKKPEPYDEPWKVSNRQAVPYVRRIDGRTAYHLITGDPNAIDDLLHTLPFIFKKVLSEETSLASEEISEKIPEDYLNKALLAALPKTSALDTTQSE
ncbi:Eco47II family restriction endonuclease [Corynebacterium anserum]|uniref:Eco47II family restriction endonuclease n=1 Tax=Corynebacterium anserum TaxID=2684406 RepID=A0A7G7YLH8_9CORY|nr:Eco47II family restriction endonuclease [Corynebacterium anserum]MBC2682577.1 Eco47II family restriction endonuclease [Corynebacterium anserum]QNH95348.1 Eco47II family restriction endonuclease [Corynebacterium anserum]